MEVDKKQPEPIDPTVTWMTSARYQVGLDFGSNEKRILLAHLYRKNNLSRLAPRIFKKGIFL